MRYIYPVRVAVVLLYRVPLQSSRVSLNTLSKASMHGRRIQSWARLLWSGTVVLQYIQYIQYCTGYYSTVVLQLCYSNVEVDEERRLQGCNLGSLFIDFEIVREEMLPPALQ